MGPEGFDVRQLSRTQPQMTQIAAIFRAVLPVVACNPVAEDAMPKMVDGTPRPIPSVRHTVTECEVCEVEVWIGPNQRNLLDAIDGAKLCYACALIGQAMTGQPSDIVSLNPAEANVPRRKNPYVGP